MSFDKEEYKIGLNLVDLERLKQEIEYEIKEFGNESSDDTILLYGNTVYQIMQIINILIYGVQIETKTPCEIIKE